MPDERHRSRPNQEGAEQKVLLADVATKYEQTLATFGDERFRKEGQINTAFHELSGRLSKKIEEGVVFGESEQAILKLKLARYFQRAETVDANTLFDALLETPKFLQTEKGGLHRLLEIHEQKTLQAIAEIRKQRADITGNASLNPYEALFTTASGKFYVARLLNLPHLQEESAYMEHCVGTSTSYVNKIKKGEVEILSVRTTPVYTFNEQTGTNEKTDGDKPILTIEYDPKKKQIIQLKKHNDELITEADITKLDLFDILEQITSTTTDSGESRDFSRIAPSEIANIKVQKYHVLTRNGEVSYKNFNVESGEPYLKAGEMPLENLSKENVAAIVTIFTGLRIKPEAIAQNQTELNKKTKLYIGPLYTDFFKNLPDTVAYIYTSLPEGEVKRDDVTIGGKTAEQLLAMLEAKKITVTEYAKAMMRKNTTTDDYGTFNPQSNKEAVNLVRLNVRDLGFPSGATTKQIFDQASTLGLELCPPEVGPHFRLKYADQPYGECLSIAMKQIADPGGSSGVFDLRRDDAGLELHYSWADPGSSWSADDELVFRLRHYLFSVLIIKCGFSFPDYQDFSANHPAFYQPRLT